MRRFHLDRLLRRQQSLLRSTFPSLRLPIPPRVRCYSDYSGSEPVRKFVPFHLRRNMSEPAPAAAEQPAPRGGHGNAQGRKFIDAPQRASGKNKTKKAKKVKPGDEILAMDVNRLLAKHPKAEENTPPVPLMEQFSIVELTIEDISSMGDGLAVVGQRVYVVPFCLPGEVVEAKVVRHAKDLPVTECDLEKVIKKSPERDDSLIGCKYFGKCAGCQYQMLPYEKQLEKKREVLVRSYNHYFSEDERKKLIPEIGSTIGSPLQYGYRTKLTPHFDWFKKHAEPPQIGFNMKGQRKVLDIEDCPIGTPAVQEGLTKRRQEVFDNLDKYKKGATLLLREHTVREPVEKAEDSPEDLAAYTEKKLCITDHHATMTEYIDNFKFLNNANAFFQNNNSILPKFTQYIRDNLALPAPAAEPASSSASPAPEPAAPAQTTPPKYLVDAYCGSGLFTVTCGQAVERAIGVDISPESIKFARLNAEANGVTNAKFIAGDAEKIFADIDFPGEEATCILDPPRRGCDEPFLTQLLAFRPRRIIYVSCNVHTQARDLAFILGDERGSMYQVDSIRGFDFFPQTHHVEGVAVLTRPPTPKKKKHYSPSDLRARKENARERSFSRNRELRGESPARRSRSKSVEAPAGTGEKDVEMKDFGGAPDEKNDVSAEGEDEESRGRKRPAEMMTPASPQEDKSFQVPPAKKFEFM